MRRQRGGFATAALLAKYGVPLVKKRVLPYLMKKYIASQAGGVFKGKNRQRGNKRKKQKGGFGFGMPMLFPNLMQLGRGRRRVQRGGNGDPLRLALAFGKDFGRLFTGGATTLLH